MGRYSTFVGQDIAITDHEGLKQAMEGIDCLQLYEDGKIDFCNWNSYNDDTVSVLKRVIILKSIAPFITGYAEFLYEEGYNFRIVFKNGSVFTQRQPIIDWETVDTTPL